VNVRFFEVTARDERGDPSTSNATGSEERRRVYKMVGLKVRLGAEGALELSGDVVGFSKNGISSQ
jgi:hypothetical protein